MNHSFTGRLVLIITYQGYSFGPKPILKVKDAASKRNRVTYEDKPPSDSQEPVSKRARPTSKPTAPAKTRAVGKAKKAKSPQIAIDVDDPQEDELQTGSNADETATAEEVTPMDEYEDNASSPPAYEEGGTTGTSDEMNSTGGKLSPASQKIADGHNTRLPFLSLDDSASQVSLIRVSQGINSRRLRWYMENVPYPANYDKLRENLPAPTSPVDVGTTNLPDAFRGRIKSRHPVLPPTPALPIPWTFKIHQTGTNKKSTTRPVLHHACARICGKLQVLSSRLL